MADCKRKTANLFDKDTATIYEATINSAGSWTTGNGATVRIPVMPSTTYTLHTNSLQSVFRATEITSDTLPPVDGNLIIRSSNINSRTFTTSENAKYIVFQAGADTTQQWIQELMLNSGSTALPYEPYGWQHSLRKLTTATDTITTLPAELYADGTNATVGLKGNMQQSGTPTPTTPIQPQETGDLSENLYDASSPNIFRGYYNSTTNTLLTTENNAFIYVPLVQGKKYYVYGCKRYNTSVTIRWATTSSAPFYNIPCIRTGVFAQEDIFTITAEANENYLLVFLCGDSDYSAYGTVEDAIAANGANLVIDNGYKIPISSASTTTPVYLGEVESTRQIKKLVLDGSGNWRKYSGTDGKSFFYLALTSINTTDSPLCTHWQGVYISTNNTSIGANVSNDNNLRIRPENADNMTTADFVQYIADQYAAGTPVTVWYVLATVTTGIVNEPLRKIGDYADTVSGITIPTITGADSFDVLTTLKPSEVSLSYTGWHDATVKEWDGSQWS